MPGTPPGSPSDATAAVAKAKTVADSGIEEATDDSLKLLALHEQQAHPHDQGACGCRFPSRRLLFVYS